MTPRVAYIVDPRFPGGTSSAVAAELRAIAELTQPRIHAVTSDMFKGTQVAPALQDALDDLGLPLIWDTPEIAADIVILHNPSFLKFQHEFPAKIIARHLIAVTHENFLRPTGYEAFDVCACLDQIAQASLTLRRSLAPISRWNRHTVMDWQDQNGMLNAWDILEDDWFNICDHPLSPPSPNPQDRRGRHSRPGFEKFPSLAAMDQCFPDHAQANIILGADTFITEQIDRPHWTMLPFRAIELDTYFEMIDFMVYFTSPAWRESFGRVLSESIAAGKVVISDAATAEIFGQAVIAADPSEVDGIIANFIANPESYTAHVAQAQAGLSQFSATNFRAMFAKILDTDTKVAA